MSLVLGRDALNTLSSQAETDGSSSKALYFDKNASFAKMGLDRRIFKAVASMGYIYPSLVQTKSIPFILEGRDVLVRARTGTGKTAAYLLPIIQSVLKLVEDIDAGGVVANDQSQANSIKAVILVPTRDLIDQVSTTFKSLSKFCRDLVKCVTLGGDNTKLFQIETAQLKLAPQVIISTPARLLSHLQNKNLELSSMKYLVVDEADLVLSYGYEDDIKMLNEFFPTYFQCVLMSATLTPELDALRGILLHNPAIVQLDENLGSGKLQQYFTLVPEHEKYLHIYSHIALGVYKGKSLFFVNSTVEAFRLKLFFEQFNIPSVVLNDDLPYNSRRNIVLQFNRGVFDYLIATDLSNSEFDIEEEKAVNDAVKLEVFAETTDSSSKVKGGVKIEQNLSEGHVFNVQRSDETEEQYLDRLEREESVKRAQEKQTKKTADKSIQKKEAASKAKELGVSRGVDFIDVQTVVNVDLPLTYKSYVHRCGRTARAGKAGQAISFVSNSEQNLLEQIIEAQCMQESDGIISTREPELKPLPFNPEATNTFRYRVLESKRKATPMLIREARLKAIRSEMINSEKLKAHFEDNPHELQLLKHNKVLSNKLNLSNSLNFVPTYLIPQQYRNQGITGGKIEIGAHGGGLSSSKGRKRARQTENKKKKQSKKQK